MCNCPLFANFGQIYFGSLQKSQLYFDNFYDNYDKISMKVLKIIFKTCAMQLKLKLSHF